MSYVTRLMSVIAVTGVVALPAYGRDAFGNGATRAEPQKGPTEDRKQAKEREDAYKNALKNIPEQKANKDPWAGAR
jgi:hypothetical protein